MLAALFAQLRCIFISLFMDILIIIINAHSGCVAALLLHTSLVTLVCDVCVQVIIR